jgi:hypothetical protein
MDIEEILDLMIDKRIVSAEAHYDNSSITFIMEDGTIIDMIVDTARAETQDLDS